MFLQSFFGKIMFVGKLVCILLLCILLFGFCNRLFRHFVLGYPDTPSPQAAAEWLVNTKRDPELCRKMPGNMWFGSQAGEQQAECIFWYASLTKNPSACELIMPSSYGLSCIGAATSTPDLCGMNEGYVAWNDGRATYESCQKDDATRSIPGNQCCLIARVAFVRPENDCSALQTNIPMHDECLDSLAFKNGNSAQCNGISDANLKAGCLVKAKGMQENPQICKGCKAQVEKLSDLQ